MTTLYTHFARFANKLFPKRHDKLLLNWYGPGMDNSLVSPSGLGIRDTAHLLRSYAYIERACITIHAGWFLTAPAYEIKYRLAYHLLDHSDHVTWYRQRLSEMRGGQPDANVPQPLREVMSAALHAPSSDSLLRGLYGVIKRSLAQALRRHIERLDPAANAVEERMLRRVLPEIEAQVAWFDGLALDGQTDPWAEGLAALLVWAGQIDGECPGGPQPQVIGETRFVRPRTILLDERIRIGELTPYAERQQLDARAATVEQFKVFFNELYAAALLASILFDSAEDGHPWEFYADFCRHFWDEARHSEFGAVRLRELGTQPDVCNPILFEQSESLPVLHRLAYLTRGLESYFMPRKQPRVKEYEKNGDSRSQLFADQDWSDEISHVRYGSTWCEYLLQEDCREMEDILNEVREHLARVSGKEISGISAPF